MMIIMYIFFRYPMAMGNLGDLEEIDPSMDRPTSISLFEQAIESAKKYYNNQQVYPYTYLGGYCYRKGYYKKAIKYWAEASNVIRRYGFLISSAHCPIFVLHTGPKKHRSEHMIFYRTVSEHTILLFIAHTL